MADYLLDRSLLSSNGVGFSQQASRRGLLEVLSAHDDNPDEVLADTILGPGDRRRPGSGTNEGTGIVADIHIVAERNRVAERSGTQ